LTPARYDSEGRNSKLNLIQMGMNSKRCQTRKASGTKLFYGSIVKTYKKDRVKNNALKVCKLELGIYICTKAH
jgi:hypothetical protein